MTSRAQDKLKGLPSFSVIGWHGDRATEILADTQAEIFLARKIIASELGEFESSIRALDARIDHNSEAYSKVAKSKQRKLFDLKVTQVDRQPRVGFTPPFEPSKCALAAEISETFIQWLNQNYPAGSLLIASKAAAKSYLSARQLVGLHLAVHLVVDDDGEIELSNSSRPGRYRPSKDSLANWIATTKPSQRTNAIGYAIGPKPGAALLELFRFRLAPGQFVALVDGTPAATTLLNEWDGEITRTHDRVLIFTNPGSRFLDPAIAPDIHDHAFSWPKISVVTVSYNQAAFLEDCICSILDQDYPNLEYIVIDAESNDGSQEILRRYEDRFTRLKIEKDNGQSEGLNKGLALATGEILTWINSDDMLAPGSLKRAAIAFMQYDCDMIVGGCERITKDSQEVTLLHHPALPFCRNVPLGFVEQLIWSKSWAKGDYFYQPEVMFSAEIWRRSGGYLKEHLYWAMDWELWIRMAMASATIVHLPDTIGRSREHPDQKTTSAELYLYQLKNILIEHDEALKLMEPLALNLPRGRTPQWPPAPSWSTLRQQIARKTWQSLQRKNQRFKNSKIINRLKKYRDPDKLKRSIRRRFTKNRDKRKLLHTTPDPSLYQNLLKAERQITSLQDQIELLTVRDHELSNATSSSYKKVQALTDAIAEYASQHLSGLAANNDQREFVHREVEAETPIELILRKMASKVSIAENEHTPTIEKRVFDLSDGVQDYWNFPKSIFEATHDSRIKIVDIGAQDLISQAHVYAPLQRAGKACVVGFEPLHDHKNSPRRVDQDVLMLDSFVGSGEPAVFHITEFDPASSLYEPNQEFLSQFEALPKMCATVSTELIQTIRLDDVPEIQDCDYLKIDVQGAELDVLQGGKNLLSKVVAIHCEVEFAPVYKNQPLFADIDMFLRSMGFELIDLTSHGYNRYKALPGDPSTGSRLLWTEAIYFRNPNTIEERNAEKLLRAAYIAHVNHGMHDLAARLLIEFDKRRGATTHQQYLSAYALRNQNTPNG